MPFISNFAVFLSVTNTFISISINQKCLIVLNYM
nr:MAG TPA: hypothetical protein [Caudoviricetes sp.]